MIDFAYATPLGHEDHIEGLGQSCGTGSPPVNRAPPAHDAMTRHPPHPSSGRTTNEWHQAGPVGWRAGPSHDGDGGALVDHRIE